MQGNIVKVKALMNKDKKSISSLQVTLPIKVAQVHQFKPNGKAMWVANPSGQGLILVPLNND